MIFLIYLVTLSQDRETKVLELRQGQDAGQNYEEDKFYVHYHPTSLLKVTESLQVVSALPG